MRSFHAVLCDLIGLCDPSPPGVGVNRSVMEVTTRANSESIIAAEAFSILRAAKWPLPGQVNRAMVKQFMASFCA